MQPNADILWCALLSKLSYYTNKNCVGKLTIIQNFTPEHIIFLTKIFISIYKLKL